MAKETNEEVIKEKRRLLHFLCWVVQLVGWVLIAGGAVWFVMFVCGPVEAGPEGTGEIQLTLYAVSRFSFDFVFVGLAAIILSQLARYVFDRGYKPGLMLRCGDKILYLFAVLAILWALFRYGYSVEVIADSSFGFLFAQPLILPTIAKVLILVGLGQILKRIIPIIEEYKTLV